MKEITINELKGFQLEILAFIHQLCQQHAIKYSLGYGTLLGAIRHNGYIPWDDDIDIIMSRPEYTRFREIINSENEHYNLLSILDHPFYPYLFSKVELKNTFIDEHSFYSTPIEIGINIDIFIYEGTPNDPKLRTKYIDRLKFFRKIYTIVYNLKYLKLSKKRSIVKNFILFFFKIILYPVNSFNILKKLYKYMSKYNYNESDIVMSFEDFNVIDLYFKNSLEKTKLINFEGYSFMAFENYDVHLSKQYGEYMKIPPIEDRVSHGDKAFVNF